MQENAHSITVLGAGGIGIACAVHLLRDGHRVTIIDRLPHGCLPVSVLAN